MISYSIYKLIHLLGIFLVIGSLSGIAYFTANGGTKATNRLRAWSGALHGVGLFLILIGWFWYAGTFKDYGVSLAGLGFCESGNLVGSRRFDCFGFSQTILFAKILWFAVPFLGVLSAYFAIIKPF
jgi:hypothetical protein